MAHLPPHRHPSRISVGQRLVQDWAHSRSACESKLSFLILVNFLLRFLEVLVRKAVCSLEELRVSERGVRHLRGVS